MGVWGISVSYSWKWVKYIKILTNSYMHQLQDLYQIAAELHPGQSYPLILAPTLTYSQELWKVTTNTSGWTHAPQDGSLSLPLSMTGEKLIRNSESTCCSPPTLRGAAWPACFPGEVLPEQTTPWKNPRSTERKWWRALLGGRVKGRLLCKCKQLGSSWRYRSVDRWTREQINCHLTAQYV